MTQILHGRTRALLALLLVTGLTACQGDDTGAKSGAETEHQDARPGEEGTVTLDTTAIRLGGIRIGTADSVRSISLPVTGTITYDANRVTYVGPRTGGRILTLNVDVGRRVRRGDILVELESADVGQARADEQRAVALLRIAVEHHERERRLEQQGISSRKEVLGAEAEVRRLEAELQSARDRLGVFGAGHGTGGHFDITAPFDGTVVARAASLGQSVGATDTLFILADLSRVWIELDIFERDLARVRTAQPVAVSTAAFPGRNFPGRIVHIGEILDPVRRAVRARVEVPNTDGALRPGMFATADIRVAGDGTISAAVPQAAVQEVEGKRVVFVPGEHPGEFRAVPVEVGEAIDGDRVIIRAGLAPGDRVVVAGAFALRSELAKGEIGDHGHGS